MARDNEGLANLAAKLDQQSPFSGEVALRNIITVINADTNVNVQNLFIVSKGALTKMEGQAVFSYSYKSTNAVKTLASHLDGTVDKERGMDPALPSQIFIVVSQSGHICLEGNEVWPFAISSILVWLKWSLMKHDKAPHLHAVRTHVTSSKDDILRVIPNTWPLRARRRFTDLSIEMDWWKHIQCNCRCIRVFHGRRVWQCHCGPLWIRWLPQYDGQCASTSIASEGCKQSRSDATKFVRKKDEFLSNALIQLISGRLRDKGSHTIQAEWDAHLDIIKQPSQCQYTSRQLSLANALPCWSCCTIRRQRTSPRSFTFFQTRVNEKGHNIPVLKRLLGGDVYSDMLFIHAFSWCGTTSRIFGVKKKYVCQKVIAGDYVSHECSKVFHTPTPGPATMDKTGYEAMESSRTH